MLRDGNYLVTIWTKPTGRSDEAKGSRGLSERRTSTISIVT
jgi:hypothetical protein